MVLSGSSAFDLLFLGADVAKSPPAGFLACVNFLWHGMLEGE